MTVTWNKIILEELLTPQLDTKFPPFCGTRRFVTAFTRACYLTLSWRSLVLASSYFSKICFNIILPTPMSPKWSLSFKFFYQNSVCISLLLLACHMPNPSHVPLLDHLNNIWWTVKSWNYEAPHYAFPPVSYHTLALMPKYAVHSSAPYSRSLSRSLLYVFHSLTFHNSCIIVVGHVNLQFNNKTQCNPRANFWKSGFVRVYNCK